MHIENRVDSRTRTRSVLEMDHSLLMYVCTHQSSRLSYSNTYTHAHTCSSQARLPGWKKRNSSVVWRLFIRIILFIRG